MYKTFMVRGVVVPLLTPLSDGGERVDEAALRAHVTWLIERGVHGLMPCGTTSEGPLLSIAERRQVASVVVEAAAGRIPIIVHAGAINTRDTIELARHARDVGAQAVSIVPPFYYRYSDQALFHHYERVATELPDLAIYLYDNPAVAGNHLTAQLITQLAEHCPNIVGIKDSSGTLDTLAACTWLRNGRFNTASGSDALILAAVAIGCHACVSGNANVVPELVVALYRAAALGDLEAARPLQRQLNAVRRILEDGSDLSLFKGILARRGIDAGSVRAPLTQAPPEEIERCWNALLALGLTF